MSKHVRGTKKNQIIQRWLQGIDDPEYDVLPTKKEGKYIVKVRDKPLAQVDVPKKTIEKDISTDKSSVVI